MPTEIDIVPLSKGEGGNSFSYADGGFFSVSERAAHTARPGPGLRIHSQLEYFGSGYLKKKKKKYLVRAATHSTLQLQLRRARQLRPPLRQRDGAGISGTRLSLSLRGPSSFLPCSLGNARQSRRFRWQCTPDVRRIASSPGNASAP